MNFTLLVALNIIWEGRRRYIPGIIAVAFSLILTALQCGIFFGLISTVTIPIVESTADIWVTFPSTRAVDLARPISTEWRDVLLSNPAIDAVDEMILTTNFWTSKSATTDLIVVVGFNTADQSLGPIRRLSQAQRALLTEPAAVILDKADMTRLNVTGIGDDGHINGRNLRVVGFIDGMNTLTGSCIMCSLETARSILNFPRDRATFLLVKCRPGASIPETLKQINGHRGISAWTAEGFANQSMLHWISKTKAGVAVAFIALLGLTVGGAVTSQTLYAATTAMMKEFAALQAMGIPRHRTTSLVVMQSFVMSVLGLAIGTPMTLLLAFLAKSVGTEALMPIWLLSGASVLTLGMGLISGLIASQSLRHIEPATLLR